MPLKLNDGRPRGAAVLFLVLFGCAQAADAQATREELIEAARTVMAAAPFAALATLDEEGRPAVRAMDPLAPDSAMVVWLATNPSSRKVGQIEADGRVALHYLDAAGPGYVTLHGTATVVRDPQAARLHWKQAWDPFYPDRDTDVVLIRVEPMTLEVISVPHGANGDAETWRAHTVDFPSSRAGR